MRAIAILNRDGGTFKTTDIDQFAAHLRSRFDDAGHSLAIRTVSAERVSSSLHEAAACDQYNTVIAGGGDGTISTAAGIAWRFGKTLGVLPAGTMNLFARSLGVPLEIHQAADCLANATAECCDIATANGRPFVHHFSVGLQPKIVKERDSTPHRSRFDKIITGIRVTLGLFSRPPSFRARLDLDGETIVRRLSILAVSNNPYGEGHIPYADRLDGGVLGVYHAGVLNARANIRLAADLTVGSWSFNPDFKVGTASVLHAEFFGKKRTSKATLDGELIDLDTSIVFRIHAGELCVLKPQDRNRERRCSDNIPGSQ